MEYWQYLLVLAVGLLLLLAVVCSAVRKYKERKHRDFTRKLETLLQPRETIKVICPQKKGHCILTSHRLIFEKKENFSAFPLTFVTKVQGINAAGNRTAVPKNMVRMTVQARQEYVIFNTAEDFAVLAAQLLEKVKKQNERKKKEKA